MYADKKSIFRFGFHTRKDVLKGKTIRKNKDGGDVFEDYFTDTESDESSTLSTKSSYSSVSVQAGRNADISKKQTTSVLCSNSQPESSKSNVKKLKNTLFKPTFESNLSVQKDVSAPLHISKKSVESRKSTKFLRMRKNPDYDEIDREIMQMCEEENMSSNKSDLCNTHEKDLNISNAENELIKNSCKHINEKSRVKRKKSFTKKLLEEENREFRSEKIYDISNVSTSKHNKDENTLNFSKNLKSPSFQSKKEILGKKLGKSPIKSHKKGINLNQPENVESESSALSCVSPDKSTSSERGRNKVYTKRSTNLNKHLHKSINNSNLTEGFQSNSVLSEKSLDLPNKNVNTIKNYFPSKTLMVSPKNAISRDSAKHNDKILMEGNSFEECITPDNEYPSSNKRKSHVSSGGLSDAHVGNSDSNAENISNVSTVSSKNIISKDPAKQKNKASMKEYSFTENTLSDNEQTASSNVFKRKSRVCEISNKHNVGSNTTDEERFSTSQNKKSKINNKNESHLQSSSDDEIFDNVLETCDIDNSHKQKTIKKRKIVEKNANKKKRKNFRKSKSFSNECIRKSSRRRFPPLAGWRNERLVYDVKGEIIDIEKGFKGDDGYLPSIYKRMKTQKNKIPKPKKAKLVSAKNEKFYVTVFKRFTLTPWNKSENELESSNHPYLIKRVFETDQNGFGFLQIEINGEKPEQYMPEEDLQMTVIKGNIEFNIQENHYTAKEKDMFIIPRNCAYSIKNIGKVKALLSFVVGKFHVLEQ